MRQKLDRAGFRFRQQSPGILFQDGKVLTETPIRPPQYIRLPEAACNFACVWARSS